MKINSMQELEDKTIHFSGELTPTEGALVISLGLNTLAALGMMSMLPSIAVTESFNVKDTLQ